MAESPDTEASSVAHVQYLKNAKEFSARLRSLELTVSNKTNSATSTYAGEYFERGTWFEDISPSIIKPNEIARGYVANRQGAPTGVKGGLSFSIATDAIQTLIRANFLFWVLKILSSGTIRRRSQLKIETKPKSDVKRQSMIDTNLERKVNFNWKLHEQHLLKEETGTYTLLFLILN